MAKERRSLLRFPVNWPARIRIKYNDSNKSFNCCIKNINFKGIQLILEKKLPSLELLKFTIALPNGVTLPMKVKLTTHEIMEGRFNLYSFQIIQMKDSDKELVYHLISKDYFAELLKLWWKDVR
jgi:hypothetical protein